MKRPKRLPLVTRLKARLPVNPLIALSSGQKTYKFKNILETDVDEKYHLRNEIVKKISEYYIGEEYE